MDIFSIKGLLEFKGYAQQDRKGVQIARIAQVGVSFVMADKVVIIKHIQTDDKAAAIIRRIVEIIAKA